MTHTIRLLAVILVGLAVQAPLAPAAHDVIPSAAVTCHDTQYLGERHVPATEDVVFAGHASRVGEKMAIGDVIDMDKVKPNNRRCVGKSCGWPYRDLPGSRSRSREYR